MEPLVNKPFDGTNPRKVVPQSMESLDIMTTTKMSTAKTSRSVQMFGPEGKVTLYSPVQR